MLSPPVFHAACLVRRTDLTVLLPPGDTKPPIADEISHLARRLRVCRTDHPCWDADPPQIGGDLGGHLW
jgi:hypothetical protein